MQIDDIQVISFDKFNFKISQSVDYDENIRIHLNFVSHFIQKKVLLEESKVKEDTQDMEMALVTTKHFIENQMNLITRSMQAKLMSNQASSKIMQKPAVIIAQDIARLTQNATFEYFDEKEIIKKVEKKEGSADL